MRKRVKLGSFGYTLYFQTYNHYSFIITNSSLIIIKSVK